MLKITIENKSLVDIHGLKPGCQTKIKADSYGVPLDKMWRDRLRDSKVDQAIVIVDESKPEKKGGKK